MISVRDEGGIPTQHRIASHPKLSKVKEGSKANKTTLFDSVFLCLSWVVFCIFFPFSIFFTFKRVPAYMRVTILRNGKMLPRSYGPGVVFYLPCIDAVYFIDLRTICYCVPPQEVLTKDSLTVSVDAVMFYRIVSPVAVILRAVDYNVATQLLAATTLRNAIGTRLLSEILLQRSEIGQQLFSQIKDATRMWGIDVIRMDLKDINLPLQLQKAMAAEAESARLALAKIIVANSEIEATKSLQIATDLLTENPYAMQLRYLQSLHTITNSRTQTYVLPISVDVLSKMFK